MASEAANPIGRLPSAAGGEVEDLHARFAQGDTRAFDELVARHEPHVTSLAYRLLGWSADVEDVVQEVFVSVWRHRGRFRGQAAFTTWLTAITLNKCRSQVRRQAAWRRLRGLFRNEPRPQSAEDAAAHPAEQETAAGVRRAVQALAIRDREVIVLRYLEELSVAEMARVLGASSGAIEVRLHRARQRLRKILEPTQETG